MTAIGCRAAAAGVTSSPSRGAGTSTGLGLGVGVGDGLSTGGVLLLADGPVDGPVDGDAVGVRATRLGLGATVVGEQPTSRTAKAIASPTC